MGLNLPFHLCVSIWKETELNKIQKLNFGDIYDFLDYLPDNELKVVEFLRQIILDCIPNCSEKLAYNVPYFYKNSRICFIWPPSVPWGNIKIKGVQLGFCNGHLLQDSINYLDKGTRKQVYWKEFNHIKDIDTDLVKTYLFEAVAVDEKLKK